MDRNMANAEVNSGAAATGAEPADHVLLERFGARRDEAAFAALVRRHGPMVLAVCRRVLQHEQDAEDAFQAVFCVLARKAVAIRRGTALSGWLYVVASRIARKAKGLQVRRRMREKELPDVPAPDNPPAWEWRDLWPILDEEVNRLPERYRQPFVLCELEGKTNQEAAAELRCPAGTVSSRLTRARERLRARLARRGLALSAGTLAAALVSQTSAAVVPTGLTRIAVQTGLGYSAGLQVIERVAELANSFLKSQALTRWIKVAGLLALTGSVLIALLFATLGRKAQPVLGPKAQTDPELLQGTWNATNVWANGRPLPVDGIDIVFAGDRVTWRFPRMPPLSPTFRVDPSKDPKEIDLVVGPGVTWPGIYRLAGDRLQLCVDMTGGRERPASLSGERFFYYELQRVPAVRR
jgi:RNA polymerase sigma factor (sigma-70 family)